MRSRLVMSFPTRDHEYPSGNQRPAMKIDSKKMPHMVCFRLQTPPQPVSQQPGLTVRVNVPTSLLNNHRNVQATPSHQAEPAEPFGYQPGAATTGRESSDETASSSLTTCNGTPRGKQNGRRPTHSQRTPTQTTTRRSPCRRNALRNLRSTSSRKNLPRQIRLPGGK